MPVNIASEIGRLKSVLLHEPGPELLAVTPATREDYLYDDIIDVDTARLEHRRLAAVLERFTTVHYVRDLLAEAVADRDARGLIIREAMDIVPSAPVAEALATAAPEDVVRILVEGREEEPGLLARTLNECGYALPPLPNLFFTRDTAMGVGTHVMIGSMRYGIRWPEELIMKTLFAHHPLLANDGILFDGSTERRLNYTLEGGDIHPLRPDMLMIGFSERSSPAAIDELVSRVFAQTRVTDVIIVVMPAENTAIHLDMVFTQIDRGQCVVHAPFFLGAERLSILHWHKGDTALRETPTVFAALEACGMKLDPIVCGGQRRIVQEREQWSSGCNFVAIRPGLVISYARNEATLAEMERAGFKVVLGTDFLSGAAPIGDDERAVIAIEGNELVRAGGGPRCMTCPIEREDVW